MKLKLLVFLLLLVIAGGGFAAWTEIESKNATIAELEAKNAELTLKTNELTQQASALEASKEQAAAELLVAQEANCKGIWKDGICEELQQVFISPVGGETLCFGKTVEVKWDSSLVNTDTVDIFLGTSTNSAKLATLPNSGAYSWKLQATHKPVGDGPSFTIAAGLYGLRITSADGKRIGKDTDLFSLKKCGGAAAKPAAKKAPAKKAKPSSRKKQ